MGGNDGGTNPEQLLAAGFAACFHGALMLLAARDCIVLPPLNIVAPVSFARDPVAGLFLLTAQMRVELPGADRAVAEELVRNTERLCPYTTMFRQGIAFGEDVVVWVCIAPALHRRLRGFRCEAFVYRQRDRCAGASARWRDDAPAPGLPGNACESTHAAWASAHSPRRG